MRMLRIKIHLYRYVYTIHTHSIVLKYIRVISLSLFLSFLVSLILLMPFGSFLSLSMSSALSLCCPFIGVCVRLCITFR